MGSDMNSRAALVRAARRRRARGGFSLLELLAALVILSVALVSLGAAVSQGIGAAGESINQRAAREACRAKLEGLVAGLEQSDSGSVENHEAFTWSATREEKLAGASDQLTEKYIVLTVTVKFPSERAAATADAGAGTGTVKLTTLLLPPDLVKKPQ